MTKGYAVIGANAGDEGKGNIVSYLVSQVENPLVIRFNGGAQAGHTVTSPEGTRHIFSHFGSGTLAGAPTYLSKYFVVNPILFNREYDVLLEKGIAPEIIVSPDCIITTPFDMMINQAIENRRAGDRHGSCGYGIFETINRNKNDSFTLRHMYQGRVRDIFFKYLRDIRDKWIPHRLRELRLNTYDLDPSYKDDSLIESFMEDCYKLIKRIVCLETEVLKRLPHTYIFEGAQGLLLDQDNTADMPFLTPSHTGIRNVLELAEDMGIDEIEAHYVSRTYLTRHGPGPLPNEMDMGLTCKTNVENTWQGKLRYAPLDLEALIMRVVKDSAISGFKLDVAIDFTHADVGRIPFVFNHLVEGTKIDTIDADTIPNRLAGNPDGLVSYGPCATDVKKHLTFPKAMLF